MAYREYIVKPPSALKVAEPAKLHGFRFFLNTKTMLKSLAVLNSRTTVTDHEFEEFLELSRYLNFQFNPI